MATTREIWYSDRAEDIRQFLADAANPAPKTNPAWGHIATFIVWSVLFLVIASFVIRHLRKRNGRLPRRPVTEKSLRSILFGRGGWLLLLVLGLALLIAYGGSEPIVELREQILAVWEQLDYEEALETLGRSFSGVEADKDTVAVFGQQILGFGTGE